MEIQHLVFDAARHGELNRLKAFLDHRPKEEIAMLVSSLANGTTPLIIACKHGHLAVASYLIGECHADIEQVSSVIFDGERIDEVPPLWCAAAIGHLDLVKLLLKYKASVNSTTKTNSTPLRAACFFGHFEIVKYLIQHGADIEIANMYGHTSLMAACYKGHYEISKYLVECGANVNSKTVKGNTALHNSAESGNIEILKLLLENDAKYDYDSKGITPLLSAAVTGHATIVEHFIQEFNCTKYDKIDALELLGASFIDKKGDILTAVDFWRRAMFLRYEDKENLLEKPTVQSAIASYIEITEVQTLSQLEELSSDPDEIRMQALLVRERILGPEHLETVYYIICRGTTYSNNGNFDRCIQLWMCALDIQQKVQEPFSPMTHSIILDFADLVSHMMSETWLFAHKRPAVSIQDILHVFEIAVKEIESALQLSKKQLLHLNDSDRYHNIFGIVMHFIVLMCQLQSRFDKKDEIQYKKLVHHFVRMNPRWTDHNGWTPLHFACFNHTSTLGIHAIRVRFPSYEVINVLLEAGACPNAMSINNNTPLHFAAMNKSSETVIFNSLLRHGAHLDICNSKQETPLQFLQSNPNMIEIYPLQHIKLQCLCAQVVKSNEIPYKGFVQKRLEEFIDFH